MRLVVGLTIALIILSIVSSDIAQRPPESLNDFPRLRGPNPNAQLVVVSREIASPEDPVFYVVDPEDQNRVIAYGWDGGRRGELIISSDEPYGLIPSQDGTMVLLAYADAHVVSGGENIRRVDAGMWAGDNEHLCVFLNELGGHGGVRERQTSENTFEGQATAATLFLENTSGERKPVIAHGAFDFHGGPELLACDAEADRAVIAQSFIAHLSDLKVVRLSDGQVLYQDANDDYRGVGGMLASRDGTALAEGCTSNYGLCGRFIVRNIPSGEQIADIRKVGGIVTFSDDNTRVITVQYLNGSNEFGVYRVIELATSRVVWFGVLSPGRVLTRPDSADFIVTDSIREPSGAPDGRLDLFEDMWLIPESGEARLLLRHSSPVR
jgi:hypothetical protein